MRQSDHKSGDQAWEVFNPIFHREEKIHREHHETFDALMPVLTVYFSSQSAEVSLTVGLHLLRYVKKCANATKDKRFTQYRVRSIMNSLEKPRDNSYPCPIHSLLIISMLKPQPISVPSLEVIVPNPLCRNQSVLVNLLRTVAFPFRAS
jgi:hypothetical protein